MNKRAALIRLRLIEQEHQKFMNSSKTKEELISIIDGSLFSNFLDSSCLGFESIQKFAFSVYITEKLLDEYLGSIESLEDYYFVSKIVEHCYYKLLSSLDSVKVRNNLAVSKEYGVFYTPIEIAREMANDVLDISQSGIVIDPCCGTGNLLAACLEQSKVNNKKLVKVIGIEMDPLAVRVCRESLEQLKKRLGIDAEIEIIESDALEYLGRNNPVSSQYLPKGSIIINPPYGKLKIETSITTNLETKLDYLISHIETKKVKNQEAKDRIKRLSTVNKNNLEWSTIFLELCVNKISQGEGLVYLGPCAWLNSKAQSILRENLLTNQKLRKVHFISEVNTGFETVNQALACVNITADSVNPKVNVSSDYSVEKSLSSKTFSELKQFGYPIPRASAGEIRLYIELQKHKKVSEIDTITNLRGELDQSLNKLAVSQKKSPLRLIRGENIGRYSELKVDKDREFFIDVEQFNNQIALKPKGKAYEQPRIVCRQCSYMKQERRLIFSSIPKNCVVGNSCNYLTVPNADTDFYLALFNSSLFDWYFRVLNGNNHVANYEINNFPIPTVSKQMKESIIAEVKELKAKNQYYSRDNSTKYFFNEAKLDSLIFEAFGLTHTDIELILNKVSTKQYIASIFDYLKKGTH